MDSNYYYILSFLPEYHWADIHGHEHFDYEPLSSLFDEVMDVLSEKDQVLMRYIKYPVDNENLINLLRHKSAQFHFAHHFAQGGNYSREQLQYEITAMDSLPLYLHHFLEALNDYHPDELEFINIDYLHHLFYEEVTQLGNSFLSNWFKFERDLENILTAIECRKHGEFVEKRETFRIGQKTGPRLMGSYDVTESILHSKSLDFSLSGILPWVARVLEFDSSHPLQYEKDIIRLKLDMLDELVKSRDFGLDMVLAYMIRLNLFIRWGNFKAEKGQDIFQGILERAAGKANDLILSGKQ